MDEEKIKIQFNRTTFICSNCKKNTDHKWFQLMGHNEEPNSIYNNLNLKRQYQIQDYYISNNENIEEEFYSSTPQGYVYNAIEFKIFASQCNECKNKTIWIKDNKNNEKLIWPKFSVMPDPNDDMDEECKIIFNEARLIFEDSPKAAAALLRVVLEKNIKIIFKLDHEDKITLGQLLQKSEVQEVLNKKEKLKGLINSVKHLGNEGTHSSRMIFDDDTKEDTKNLFKIINFICDELISNPKKYDELQKELNNKYS